MMGGMKSREATVVNQQTQSCLGLACVLPPVLVVNALEVVATRPDIVERALRNVRARIVVLLPQLRSTVSTVSQP